MYHRVNDDHDPFFLYAMPVSQFRQQMEYLTRNFHVISLDQIARGDFSSNGQKHCVAITFDDGYRDNFLCAFPVLKELGIPATIFLATGYIESGELPWYDQVCLAFKLTLQSRISLSEVHGKDLSLDTRNARLHTLQHTLAVLRAVNEATRLQLLRELFQQLRVPARLNLPNVMLSWDEVRRMSKQGIGFGAHTVTHPVLASLSGERLEDEVVGSKKTVENRLQLPVRHFAYPFGKPFDVGPEAKRLVKAAGFETAVTTVSGINDPAQDPFELKRFGLREPDMGMFSLKVDWNRMSDTLETEHVYEQGRTI
jgi:peptidoglycan/xylan/chitin deacetylase (PgdA/CDA1 family)